MPVHKVGRKWAIGNGKPIYRTKVAAERAYRGYLAAKNMRSGGRKRRQGRKRSRR